MIELIAPDGVVVQALRDFQDYPLFPEEVRSLGIVVEKRRIEFATGRECARRAMVSLGRSRCPIATGSRREPKWPTGITGSITHCSGYCAAAVADSNRLAAIGIDAEENSPLPDGVLEVIATIHERTKLPTTPVSCIHWDRLLFCAKESVFKAWYTITHQWLDFDECAITFGIPASPAPLKRGGLGGEFTAQLSRSYGISGTYYSGFKGKYICDGHLLGTLVAVDKPGI